MGGNAKRSVEGCNRRDFRESDIAKLIV